MSKRSVSGLVDEIENVDEGLSFVTLGLLGYSTVATKRQPIFMRLPQELIHKVVDVVNINDGETLRQYVIGSDTLYDVSLTVSEVKKRLSDYLESINLAMVTPETVFPYELS